MQGIIICILGVLAFSAPGISAQCDYSQSLVPGTQYQIFSPGYYANYPAYSRCSWFAQAPPGYKIELSCNEFVVPCYDSFVVNQYGLSSGSADIALCNRAPFSLTSLTNALSVRLSTVTNSGRFFCTLKAVADACQCGRRQTSRIVGGTTAQVNEFPYQALMTDMSGGTVCGAAIISEYYSLTAAHCVAGRTNANTRLVVGEHDLTIGSESNITAVYNLASPFIPHASYNPATGVNDVALIRTVSPIVFSVGVGVVCLPFIFGSNLFTNNLVTVAGWGTTEYGGKLSQTLLKADTYVIANSVCAAKFPEASSNDYICTLNVGHDTCQSDSGTSLYYQYNARVYSVGVTSRGNGCGGSSPSLNMRVSQYLNWIMQNTPGATYCSI